MKIQYGKLKETIIDIRDHAIKRGAIDNPDTINDIDTVLKALSYAFYQGDSTLYLDVKPLLVGELLGELMGVANKNRRNAPEFAILDRLRELVSTDESSGDTGLRG